MKVLKKSFVVFNEYHLYELTSADEYWSEYKHLVCAKNGHQAIQLMSKRNDANWVAVKIKENLDVILAEQYNYDLMLVLKNKLFKLMGLEK